MPLPIRKYTSFFCGSCASSQSTDDDVIFQLCYHLKLVEPNCENDASIAQALVHCDVAVLTFDVSNRSSFESLKTKWTRWLCGCQVPTVVVGLKADLRAQVDASEVMDLCSKFNFQYIQNMSSALIHDETINIFRVALTAHQAEW